MLLNEYFSARYPEHCRESCSDENPINADVDGTGCHRCTAILFTKAEADAKDAQRYRWLRDTHIDDQPFNIGLREGPSAGLDSAIDYALRAELSNSSS